MPGETGKAVDLPLECLQKRQYDEATFLYFLGVERSRANRSNHALGLLLVTVEPARNKPIPISPTTASLLFAGLTASLRETDVVGWYRRDRVAGAVLTARSGAPGAEMSRAVRRRVSEELQDRLPPTIMRQLRVRVIELPRPSRVR